VAAFVAALKSHLALPGITADDVLRNPPKTEATAKGHLRQHLKGVRSTRYSKAAHEAAGAQDTEGVAVEDGAPIASEAEGPILPEAALFTRDSIPGVDVEEKIKTAGESMVSIIVGRLSADATGKLQVNSVMGHSAVHVTYVESANMIKINPIYNKTEVNDMIMKTYNEATALGHKINLVITDNEMSNAANGYFARLKVPQTLVEPYNHRANDAERHIQTAKRHIIATLAGRDSECGLENWDKHGAAIPSMRHEAAHSTRRIFLLRN
jgi:hypothetical protein